MKKRVNLYKQDLTDGNDGCIVFSPLQNEGQCKYLNEWYEQKKQIEHLDKICTEYEVELVELVVEVKVLKRALELACKYTIPENSKKTLRFCDTNIQIESWQELASYVIQQAKEELENEQKRN